MLSCKPNYWMPPEVQKAKLRRAGADSPAESRAEFNPAPRDSTYNEAISEKQKSNILAILESPEKIRKVAANVFARFDENRDQHLDAQELNNCLQTMHIELGIPAPKTSQLKMLIEKFDVEKDGVLSVDEFTEFFKRCLLRSRESFMQFKMHCEFFVQKHRGDPWEDYQAQRELGSGTFGITHLVKSTVNGQARVMKTVNKEKTAGSMSPEELEQEIINLKKLDHPHIIKVFDYYEDAVNIYLVMEAAQGGELMKVISEGYKSGQWHPLTEAWVATVMQQVLEAIAYCHGRRLMHKDLKSENIMLLQATDARTHPHAVVIDLGLAEMFGKDFAKSQVCSPVAAKGRRRLSDDHALYAQVVSRKPGGTPYTMAPEVWEFCRTQQRGFGMKCDVYSLGVVLFQLLTGTLPFSAPGTPQMTPAYASGWLRAIARGPPRERLASSSVEAKDLVCRLLAFEENDRPTAREATKHAWFEAKSADKKMQLSHDQMQMLVEFEKKNEFQKAVLLQAASQLRAVEIPRINAIFRTYDADNTGYLSEDDLVKAFQALGCEEATAKRVIRAIDLDKDGKIEYTEFASACVMMFNQRLEKYVWGIFKKLDTDNSGTLEYPEVIEVLKSTELHNLGCVPSGTEIQNMLHGMDPLKTGKITFNDFYSYITRREQA